MQYPKFELPIDTVREGFEQLRLDYMNSPYNCNIVKMGYYQCISSQINAVIRYF